jgi:N-ethylmaleimide reductase
VAKANLNNHPPSISASPTPIVNRHGNRGKTVTYEGIVEHEIPRELPSSEIPRLCEDYAHAAQNAKEAGFDGVELHAAHGYLIDQFLNNGVNKRTDDYGGSVENRCRLLRNVLDAIFNVWDAQNVGVRLSPHDAPNGGNTYYGCQDSDPDVVYEHAVQMLNEDQLAYLLLTEPRWVGKHDDSPETDPGFQMPLINLQKYRSIYKGILIGAGGFTPTSSYSVMNTNDLQDPSSSSYDALAFGRWFIANPDLPIRLKEWHDYEQRGRTGAKPPPLNRYERDTFYTQQAEGYIDYPSLAFEAAGDRSRNKKEYDGMQAGKYTLVEQQDVGTRSKATEQTLQSKL